MSDMDDLDLFGDLDNTVPQREKTVEDVFMYRMLANSEQRLGALRAWLYYQVGMYWYMVEDEKVHIVRGLSVKDAKLLSYYDVVRMFIRYWLMANYGVHFVKMFSGKDIVEKKCDISLVVEMILQTETFKKFLSDNQNTATPELRGHHKEV